MAKLKRLRPLVGDQVPQLILQFIQTNGLDNLLLSLQADELNDLDKFKTALARRYSKHNKATEFHHMTQNPQEPEIDWLNRLERAWRRLSDGRELNKADKTIIYDKFVSGLQDSSSRLRIREQNPEYENLADFASTIRNARLLEETSTSSLVHKINKLSEELSQMKTSCTNCGLGHTAIECRANNKVKSNYNKKSKFPCRNFAISRQKYSNQNPTHKNYHTFPRPYRQQRPTYRPQYQNHNTYNKYVNNFQKRNNWRYPPQQNRDSIISHYHHSGRSRPTSSFARGRRYYSQRHSAPKNSQERQSTNRSSNAKPLYHIVEGDYDYFQSVE